MKTRWPWITLGVTVLAVFNPPGIDFISSAFFAGKQLSRDIGQPIVLTAAGLLVALVLIELAVRSAILRRRRGLTR